MRPNEVLIMQGLAELDDDDVAEIGRRVQFLCAEARLRRADS
ncbi:hypothetical protein PZ938_00115 [Luteipulveratus sp. YIM 133132]|nr:hypothetical protein [Luteipulveratus sp. YIM 133132]MDE9363998.1 hypothetical protein [Luteipulveratus sp. YIM 133132]